MIPIAFLVAPKYLHDDGLRWFHVGTIHLDSLSKVKMNIEDDEGVVAFDAFKLTPHIAKEVIEYDHASRAVHSKVYSELTESLPEALNPTGADLARTETFYAYDVAGHLVATRNVERVGSVQASGSQFLLQYMDETPTTVGYAYQGNQQLLSFGLDESAANYLMIKSFNLIGTSGDVLAVDSTSSGQPVQGATDQHSIWQFNNLDGTRFVDSQGWFPSDYAFAGQKLQSASSDFLLQSRDASRSTWGGGDGASFQSGGLIDRFANMNDTTMVLGTVGVSAVLAIGIVATAPVSLPALTGGQLAFRAGGAAAGGAASAISEYQRGGDAMSILAAGMGGAGSGGLNPFSGYGALAGGAAGAATAAASGGDMSAGFQWGEMVGSFAGGGVGHYGTTLAKYTAGGHGAKAVSKALQHTARSMSVEGAAMGAGAGIGAYYGGYDGALAGAQLGQLAGGVAANFPVACFTAGTPIVVDLEGNSRLIEELEVGDVVLARNEFDPNGPLELKRIEEKFVRTAAVMEVVIRDRSIKTTAEHPFYVPARGKFIAAGELKAGDELVGHSGQLVRIDSVSPLGEIATVYNFRVPDHHTYFVGCDQWGFSVWAHNASREYYNLLTKSGVDREPARAAAALIRAGDVEGGKALLWAALNNGKRKAHVIERKIDRALTQLDSLSRPSAWRAGFVEKIEAGMPRTQDGKLMIHDLVDGKVVLRERLPGEAGEIGHIPNRQHRDLVRENAALTQPEFNQLLHEHPEWFRIETRRLNASHKGEV